MVKTWSWNNATNGTKPTANPTGEGSSTGGGGFVRGSLPYEMGDLKRITIPYVLGEDGSPQMIIKSAPVHKVTKRGFIKLSGPKGGEYSPYSIRCMNALSQTSFEKGREIAERNQYCALCTLASLQTTKRFALMAEEFGSVEEYKAAPEADKKAFNLRMNDDEKIGSSYNAREKSTVYETYILVLDFVSETKEIATDFGNELVSRVKLGADGLPLYTPTLLKVSKARLDKFQTALQNAGRSQLLTSNSLYPFTDVDGQEVKTAFVDFQLEFPQRPQKMNSAADVIITAVSSEDSVITPEFVEHVKEKSTFFLEKTEAAWVGSHANLQEFTNEEYENAMEDGGAFYRELKEQYLTDRDREHAYKILETAKGNNLFKKDENGETPEVTLPSSASPSVASEPKPETANTSEAPAQVENMNDLLNLEI